MPMYDFRCPGCGKVLERYVPYAQFDEPYVSYCDQEDQHFILQRLVTEAPPIHYKGYGFFSTDNASSHERYARDHFDGSGTNSELRAMDRQVKHPESDIPIRTPEKVFHGISGAGTEKP